MADDAERRRRAADRQARYRDRLKARAEAHESGDHSQCRRDQCEAAVADLSNESDGDAGEGVTRDVTDTPKKSVPHRPRPAGLGDRGQRLWNEMAGLKLNPTHVLLLERCCRKADRLEEMDSAWRGRGWIHLVEVPNTDGAVVQVVVDKLLSEIRQTEVALKLDVAELRHAGRATDADGRTSPVSAPDPDDGTEEAVGGTVTNIASIIGGSTRR